MKPSFRMLMLDTSPETNTTLLIVKKKQHLMKALAYELARLPPREYDKFLRGTKECPITGGLNCIVFVICVSKIYDILISGAADQIKTPSHSAQ